MCTFPGPGAPLSTTRAVISPSLCSPVKRCLGFCDPTIQMKKQAAKGYAAGPAENGRNRNGTQVLSASVLVFLSHPISSHLRCCPRILSLLRRCRLPSGLDKDRRAHGAGFAALTRPWGLETEMHFPGKAPMCLLDFIGNAPLKSGRTQRVLPSPFAAPLFRNRPCWAPS